MANEFNSKVVLSNGDVLIDLTQDDVKPEHVQKGIYFHDKTGERKQGTNTKDYEKLVNKPKINGVEVVGEKSSSDYGLQDEIAFCTNLDIDKLFK